MKNKKDELLKSALKLFSEDGFHATPTSKIAKEAGVANGTLFHYYKTKEELILALYKQTQEHLAAYVYKKINKEDTLKIVFNTIYVNTIEWFLENNAESAFIRQFSNSHFYSSISTEGIISQSDILKDAIYNGVKTAILKPLSPDLHQTLINSHISGITQYLSMGEFSIINKSKILKESFEMLWDMIT